MLVSEMYAAAADPGTPTALAVGMEVRNLTSERVCIPVKDRMAAVATVALLDRDRAELCGRGVLAADPRRMTQDEAEHLLAASLSEWRLSGRTLSGVILPRVLVADLLVSDLLDYRAPALGGKTALRIGDVVSRCGEPFLLGAVDVCNVVAVSLSDGNMCRCAAAVDDFTNIARAEARAILGALTDWTFVSHISEWRQL